MNTARDAGASASMRWLHRSIPMLMLALLAPAVHGVDLRLLQGDAGVVRLQRAAAPDAGMAATQLQVATASGNVLLLLSPHGALGAIGSQGADVQAYRGVVAGQPGSWVAVTRIGARWSGVWFDGHALFGIESGAQLAGAMQRKAGGAPDDQVVFRLTDVVGDDASFEDDVVHAPPGDAPRLATSLPRIALAAEQGPTHRLRLSLVADSMLAERDGDALEANLLARLNIIDGLFRNQLGVEVVADSITTFTQPQLDPFTATDEPSALLEELSVWRAASAWQRQTPITHLFTGRDLERRTVGLAYLDTLCNRRYSASLSEARGAATFTALIAAHEIAHVFGAPHDGDAEGACATTTGNHLMAPRINGSQQFSACSLAQMAPRVASASCLVKLDPSGVPQPPAVPVSEGEGGGGAVAGSGVGLLAWMALARARRRLAQMRANQSAR